jgi:hypothetical protein
LVSYTIIKNVQKNTLLLSGYQSSYYTDAHFALIEDMTSSYYETYDTPIEVPLHINIFYTMIIPYYATK